MFQFIAVASRPPRVEELAELFAFDFKEGSIPKFRGDWHLDDPADAVLSACTTLLSVVDGGYRFGNVIQFSHFSVKEFLISARLAETTDIISRRYHISTTPAHTLAAQACLGILLHLDKNITKDSLQDFPLAEYAAENWVDHVRLEDVSRNVEGGMKQLFDPSKPHLAICVWIRDPEIPRWARSERGERPMPLLQTPLHFAASWGLHSLVEFLATKRSQDVHSRRSSDIATPLHLASGKGHEKAADKLIECGADVTTKDKYGSTPLHLASQSGQVDVARILIEAGADVAARKNDGETPLHLASRRGLVNVARILIKAGADVAAQKNDGETPLHLASKWGQVDVARMLIKAGADVTAQKNDGKTPLHLASEWGRVDVAHILIEAHADVTAQRNDGETPLHIASQWGLVDVARILIEAGADVIAQKNGGETPLHLASRRGLVDVARILIEAGADVTAQNIDGETPLHHASTLSEWALIFPHEYAKVARIFLEHGADINAQNKNGLTPFRLASQDGFAEVIRILLQHGADSGPMAS